MKKKEKTMKNDETEKKTKKKYIKWRNNNETR